MSHVLVVEDSATQAQQLAYVLEEAGFAVETFRVSPEEEVRYGLLRDEWIYVARKPGAG